MTRSRPSLLGRSAERVRQLDLRHPGFVAAAMVVLVGLAVFQGTVLSSDSSSELALAKALAHGAPGSIWHTSRYPLLASIVLLPAGLAGLVGGNQVQGFVASIEYLTMGALLAALGVRWTRALRPSESIRDRTAVVLISTAATLLWVYEAKEPMDVVIAALCALGAVTALEARRLGWVGISLGLLVMSRDQMIPVAALGTLVILIGLLRRRDLGGALRVALPAAAGALLVGLVNQSRYGGVSRFGPGYDKVVHYGTDLRTVLDSIVSINAGLLFLAPLCLVGIALTWPTWLRSGERPRSASLSVTLAVGTFASVLLIHPSADYQQIWSWGRSCRYLVPMVPLTAFLIPRRPVSWQRITVGLSAAVGFVWSLPILLVPYNAQQRLNAHPSLEGPAVWRQYELIPTVVRNSVHLIIHGSSPFSHSAYFASLWQVEAVRSVGRMSLILSIPLTIILIVKAAWIWRTSRLDSHADAD